MSGELANLLVERARSFRRMARLALQEGDYDIAVFAFEQAAQLRVKACMLRLFGEIPRVHRLRELLGLLAARLEEASLRDIAERVRSFAAEHRGLLWLLEEAYTLARYGGRRYTQSEALDSERLVEKLWRLLEEVEGVAAGGVHDREA